jgi:hypothetical protein
VRGQVFLDRAAELREQWKRDVEHYLGADVKPDITLDEDAVVDDDVHDAEPEDKDDDEEEEEEKKPKKKEKKHHKKKHKHSHSD